MRPMVTTTLPKNLPRSRNPVCNFKDLEWSGQKERSWHLTPPDSIECTPGTSLTSHSSSDIRQVQKMPWCIPSTLETTLKIPNWWWQQSLLSPYPRGYCEVPNHHVQIQSTMCIPWLQLEVSECEGSGLRVCKWFHDGKNSSWLSNGPHCSGPTLPSVKPSPSIDCTFPGWGGTREWSCSRYPFSWSMHHFLSSSLSLPHTVKRRGASTNSCTMCTVPLYMNTSRIWGTGIVVFLAMNSVVIASVRHTW